MNGRAGPPTRNESPLPLFFSTFITSAPISANIPPTNGPAMTSHTSTTRTPDSGPGPPPVHKLGGDAEAEAKWRRSAESRVPAEPSALSVAALSVAGSCIVRPERWPRCLGIPAQKSPGCALSGGMPDRRRLSQMRGSSGKPASPGNSRTGAIFPDAPLAATPAPCCAGTSYGNKQTKTGGGPAGACVRGTRGDRSHVGRLRVKTLQVSTGWQGQHALQVSTGQNTLTNS